MMKKTGWAILGTGSVSRKFALGLAALDGAGEVAAVASRDPANAQSFVASLNLGHAVQSYEEAVNDPSVDTVYIATPPALHEAHAKLAFAAGKPALIEKPLAHDAASARRIAEAAEAAGVFAMEALWTRFQPLICDLSARVAADELGELRGFSGRFLGANVPDGSTSLFSSDTGGALLHRGIYPLSLARHFLGPVREVTARGRIGETGVDEDCIVLLTHENGAVSDIRSGLRSTDHNACTIWGTDARIDIDGPVWRPERAVFVPVTPARITRPSPRRFEAFRETALGQRLAGSVTLAKSTLRRENTVIRKPVAGNGYGHEAAHLVQAVAGKETLSDIMPLPQSIEILDIIDTALSQIKASS